jgi:Spy/CpxP family protein refolding chaperone
MGGLQVVFRPVSSLNGEQVLITRHFAQVFLLTFLCSAGAAAAPLCEQQRGDAQKADASRPNNPPRFKWWLHADTKKELRLTEQQSKKIDEIWEATAPKLREKGHELEKLEDALASTIKESTADVASVAQQVEKVEKLRAEFATIRMVMIYKMHLLLNPEQRVKVDAIRAKLEAERKQRQDEERKKDSKDDERDRQRRR